MAKDPALLFYTSDFLTGTMYFSNEQVGMYIRILCLMHQKGGYLDKELFEQYVGGHTVIRKKFEETEKGYTHHRLLREMQRRSKFRDSRLNNLHKVSHMGDHKGAQMETETDTVNENIKEPNKVIKEYKKKYDFESIWKDFPSKIGRKLAEKHFQFSVKTDEDYANIKKALDRYKNSKRVLSGFVQNGSTWFNNWEDWLNHGDDDHIPESIRNLKRA